MVVEVEEAAEKSYGVGGAPFVVLVVVVVDADVAAAAVVADVDMQEVVQARYMVGRLLMGGVLVDMFSTLALLCLIALIVAFGFFEVLLVPRARSFPDRWNRGYLLVVEAAASLTWAERDMPLNEHRRTPLWPNSDQERSAPDLIFLDVRRVISTKCRGKILRIAWKWPE